MSNPPPTAHSAPASGVHAHLVEEHQRYFTFFNLSLALIAITAVELVIVYIPIHQWIILGILSVLSVVKFAGVVWWFMHLRWDKVLLTALFLIGLFIATGTLAALLLLFEQDPSGMPPM